MKVSVVQMCNGGTNYCLASEKWVTTSPQDINKQMFHNFTVIKKLLGSPAWAIMCCHVCGL